MNILKKIIRKIFSDLTSEEKSVLQALKKRPQAPYDFLMRYQKILNNSINWRELDFKDKTVIEIGCGPHLGFGPLALYLGAKKFIAVDPTVNKRIFNSQKLLDNYFRLVLKDCNGIYRKSIEFSAFVKTLKDKSIFYNDINQVPSDYYSNIDIQLTNSCLEHIENLDVVLSTLKKLLSNNGKYIHTIDFGNHMKTPNPFDEIYENSPDGFRKKFGNKINLIYPSKMIEMFYEAGFNGASMVPYYFFKEDFKKQINHYWSDKLLETDYFLKVGIIAGKETSPS